jgi:hypothetical protein
LRDGCDGAALGQATGGISKRWSFGSPASGCISGGRSITQARPACGHRFIGDVEPTFGEEIFDVSIAQREAQVEPHSILDDNRRKAVAAV